MKQLLRHNIVLFFIYYKIIILGYTVLLINTFLQYTQKCDVTKNLRTLGII